MKAAPSSPLMGERLRLPKYSAMNLKFPRRTVLPTENSPHVRCSPSTIADEGTIGMSSGKARYKYPFLLRQLSPFFAPARYRVVKIACSCSEMVLQNTKHTMFYPGSGPSLEVIALRPAV
jgi:hypothetical protein